MKGSKRKKYYRRREIFLFATLFFLSFQFLKIRIIIAYAADIEQTLLSFYEPAQTWEKPDLDAIYHQYVDEWYEMIGLPSEYQYRVDEDNIITIGEVLKKNSSYASASIYQDYHIISPTIISVSVNNVIVDNRLAFIDDPPPEIIDITPSEGEQGETLDISILGKDFNSNAVIIFIGNKININYVVFVSSEKITINITIDLKADLDACDIKITNPDGQSDTVEDTFYITQELALPIQKIRSQSYPSSYHQYHYSSPTYNYFDYNPKNSYMLFNTFTDKSSKTQNSSSNNTQISNLYFFGLYFPWAEYYMYPLYYGNDRSHYPLSSWRCATSETSSVIGNSPNTQNYTFGSNYKGVNITINNY